MEKSHLRHIGNNFQKLREFRKLSLSDVSKNLGKTENYILELESGNINFTIDELVKYASILNCILDVNLIPQ